MGFADVRARWLPVWAVGGALFVTLIVAPLLSSLGVPASNELVTTLMYLPIVAWVWLVVVRSNGVDLAVMLRWPQLGSYWLVVAGMFVVQLMFSVGAASLTSLLFPHLADSLAGVGSGSLLVAFLALVVVPPLVEETVFRGILVERWSLRWRIPAAILLSSVCFGVLHADPVGAGMFGVVLCLLYLRTRSLWPGILVHATNNLVALAAIRLGDASAQATTSTADALTTAAVALGMSIPFLVWFIRVTWPPRGTLTAYQEREAELGRYPALTFKSAVWSAWPAPIRLDVLTDRLMASPPGRRADPFAVVGVERVQSCYPTVNPWGSHVVVILDDGSWTTLQVSGGKPSANQALAQEISVRVESARRRLSSLTA